MLSGLYAWIGAALAAVIGVVGVWFAGRRSAATKRLRDDQKAQERGRDAVQDNRDRSDADKRDRLRDRW